MIRRVAATLLFVACLEVAPVSAYEQVYPPTQPGTIELKTVPARQAMQAEAPGPYFDSNNTMFRSLFDYIGTHDVSMTVPVEADIVDASRMRFFVGSSDETKALEPAGGVTVVKLPERTVLAVGLRGSYSSERFADGRGKLDTWLREHPEWIAAGPPHAVYWNGPVVPWFARRSEVHVPVVPATP